MVRRTEKFIGRWAGAVLLGLLPISALAASPLQVDRTNIAWAQQDSTGVVWGIPLYGSPALYRWEKDSWKGVIGEGIPEGSVPVALARGADGAVYCFWNKPTDTHIVTRHQGNSARQFAQFAGPIADFPRVFVDPKGTFWITERGPHIYRVTPEGKAESAYTIPGDQFLAQSRPGNARPAPNLVLATADGRGRVWFWSDTLASPINPSVLQGVLIFDDGKFQLHPKLNGVQGANISVVEPEDAKHMWVAALDDQLYRVDIDTFEAKPVAPPEPRAFETIQQIFHCDGDTFLVAGFLGQAVPEPAGGGRSGVLWRLRNGEWKKLVNGLDSDLQNFSRSLRCWVPARDGFWVGTFGSGPWFIPAMGGGARLVDWHYGYPLDGSERLFQLKDGRLLSIGLNQGSTAMKPAEILAAFQSPPEVETINPYLELVQDARGHLLGVLAAGDKALSEWDGEKWTKHPLPAGLDVLQIRFTTWDSLGRIWLFSQSLETTVAIFDPNRGSFETFPTYAEALQRQFPLQGDLRVSLTLPIVTSFTKDGRICYRDVQNRVRYFDGGRWRNWLAHEIVGFNMVPFDGPPFFDRAGNLTVQILGGTWEFAEQKGWQSIAHEAGLGTYQERMNPRPVSMPPGCAVEHPESVVQDELGVYWLTSHGQLYRAIQGLCSPQFAPEEHQPFIDSRKLLKAMIDPKGNAFLSTDFAPNHMEYVFLKAHPPLPQTSLRASADASGTITLHFSSNSKGAPSFTWRMDRGPWSAPTKNTETTVESAPGGKHRFEAAAVDERVQIDPTPAVAEIDIQAATETQIAALIQKLSHPDYALREKAVAALVRESDAALPLLRSAREKAAPDQRWWMDAAIQQIEENLSKTKKP